MNCPVSKVFYNDAKPYIRGLFVQNVYAARDEVFRYIFCDRPSQRWKYTAYSDNNKGIKDADKTNNAPLTFLPQILENAPFLNTPS